MHTCVAQQTPLREAVLIVGNHAAMNRGAGLMKATKLKSSGRQCAEMNALELIC